MLGLHAYDVSLGKLAWHKDGQTPQEIRHLCLKIYMQYPLYPVSVLRGSLSSLKTYSLVTAFELFPESQR